MKAMSLIKEMKKIPSKMNTMTSKRYSMMCLMSRLPTANERLWSNNTAGTKREKTMISMMSQRIGKKMIRKLNGILLLVLSWSNQTTSETMTTPSVEVSNRKRVLRF